MFKVLNKRTNQEIIILDPEWEAQIPILRDLGRNNLLICPGCKQPTRVRAGEIKTPHFAHTHRLNCSYRQDSPARLKARATLYRWLVTKFPGGVTLEKSLTDSGDFPQLLDCWVENDQQRFGYWIFDAAVGQEKREKLTECLKQLNASITYVFISDMLNRDNEKPDHIHLTTTERHFSQKTKYDYILKDNQLAPTGSSLHYLDSAANSLYTFRRLKLIHLPQLYAGHEEHHPFHDIRVDPKTGQFVHPGEYETLNEIKKTQASRPEKQPRKPTLHRPALSPDHYASLKDETAFARQNAEQLPHVSRNPEATCTICGQITSDWWSYDGPTGTCKCRDCLRKSHSQP